MMNNIKNNNEEKPKEREYMPFEYFFSTVTSLKSINEAIEDAKLQYIGGQTV